MGPYPLTVAGTSSPPSSVSSVITRSTATGSATSAGRAGDPLENGVGHDLAARAVIEGGVGGALERGIHPDTLGDRQQHGHIGHRVGCGPDRHRAIGLGLGRPIHHRLRIEPVGDLLGVGGDPRITQPVEFATSAHISASSVRRSSTVQAGRLPARSASPAIPTAPRTPTPPTCAASRTPTPWRTPDVCRRAPGNPAAPTPPHWPAHGTAWPAARRRRLRRRAASVQRRRQPGLTSGSSRLHPLQPRDLLDQPGLVGSIFEHTFD